MKDSERLKDWSRWVFEGNARERRLATSLLRDEPALFDGNPWVACAIGDETAIRQALLRDPAWINRPDGPLAMPPLVAVTHSRLILEDGFASSLLACASLLLRHGADVDGSWTDPRWPDAPLSALYGAAGRTHHAGMTELLLRAGANPDDNESLYHSVEGRDPTCMRLLLEAGARVGGTNAIGHMLDYDRLDDLRLLLRYNRKSRDPWLHHAILRGRSLDHITALIDAGADLRAKNAKGISLYRWAHLYGRIDVVSLLHEARINEDLSQEDLFVAACSRGDTGTARAIQHDAPDILTRLDHGRLQIMPELAGIGAIEAVRTMLALGWPLEVKAGWDATALNHAVFQGDAAMTRLLLKHGADWRVPHGFGDTVLGTLSFASQAEDGPESADFPGCAKALLAHGVPASAMCSYTFSQDVTDELAEFRPREG